MKFLKKTVKMSKMNFSEGTIGFSANKFDAADYARKIKEPF